MGKIFSSECHRGRETSFIVLKEDRLEGRTNHSSSQIVALEKVTRRVYRTHRTRIESEKNLIGSQPTMANDLQRLASLIWIRIDKRTTTVDERILTTEMITREKDLTAIDRMEGNLKDTVEKRESSTIEDYLQMKRLMRQIEMNRTRSNRLETIH